jgi:hypothetical protein
MSKGVDGGIENLGPNRLKRATVLFYLMLCNGGKRFSYKYPNTVLLGGMDLHPWLRLRHSPSAWLSWLISTSDDTRGYLAPHALSGLVLLHNITFKLGRHAN